MTQYFVHQSSYIDENVTVGEGSKIWHFCHLLSNTVLGLNCSLGQNCVVGPNVNLGNNVKVQNNVSIYDGVNCEDDVFLGPSMVFTNVINPRSHVVRKHEYKTTLVKQGASIGANATIVCGVTIGCYALIGAGTVVIKDVPDFALMVGNPARQIGWVNIEGERLALPITGDGQYIDEKNNQVYRLSAGKVSLERESYENIGTD